MWRAIDSYHACLPAREDDVMAHRIEPDAIDLGARSDRAARWLGGARVCVSTAGMGERRGLHAGRVK
jgi:hypothetical protein